MSFRVKSTTIEINKWLARRGWAPLKACNGGRAIDAYVRRYWWLHITPKRHADRRWSTKMIIDEMVGMVKRKENLEFFPYMDLLLHPNSGRLIDYLAEFWFAYEGRRKPVKSPKPRKKKR